jgi:hypothetical protein
MVRPNVATFGNGLSPPGSVHNNNIGIVPRNGNGCIAASTIADNELDSVSLEHRIIESLQ